MMDRKKMMIKELKKKKQEQNRLKKINIMLELNQKI